MSGPTSYDADHRAWDELAAGAALHALEPDEQADFDRHLPGCSHCQELLSGHEFVAAQLGTLSTGSLSTGALNADDDDAPPEWSRIQAGLTGVDELSDARRRRSLRQVTASRRILAAAAAVVVLAGAGVVTWRAEQPSAATVASGCSGVLDCHAVDLQTSSGMRVADITVVGNTATVRTDHVDGPTAGHSYVLWQMGRAQTPTAVAALNAQGTTTVSLKLPYAATAAFAISEEPSGTLPDLPTKILATAPAS
jgi:hypothetical protein